MLLKLFNKIYINPNEVKYMLPGDGAFEIAFKDGTNKLATTNYPISLQIGEVDAAINNMLYRQAKAYVDAAEHNESSKR